MSACRYCEQEVVWVPTVEGVRPFKAHPMLSPNTPVVVLTAHRCEARAQFLKSAQAQYMKDLYRDPIIRALALNLPCERCGSQAGTECRDLRKGFTGRNNKNPHQERLVAGALASEEKVEE